MSSPERLSHARSSPANRNFPPRRASTLVLQEEAPSILYGRRQGTFARIINSRSHSDLHHYGGTWRTTGPPDADTEAGVGTEATLSRFPSPDDDEEHRRRPQADERRLSEILRGPQMRSMRLIGYANRRYRWERYWKTEEQLKTLRKPLRQYYERTNYLVQQYLYIDRLLDSSLPHDLLNEYNDLPAGDFKGAGVPQTIREDSHSGRHMVTSGSTGRASSSHGSGCSSSTPDRAGEASQGQVPRNEHVVKKVKRTPKDIYRATETTPLFLDAGDDEEDDDEGPKPEIPWLEDDDSVDSGDRVVAIAIYLNFVANAILLAGKIVVIIRVSSMSVLASLVDAILDFLSTAIVWTTT
jgi:hypothetical protein